jgi:hypothetical protein
MSVPFSCRLSALLVVLASSSTAHVAHAANFNWAIGYASTYPYYHSYAYVEIAYWTGFQWRTPWDEDGASYRYNQNDPLSTNTGSVGPLGVSSPVSDTRASSKHLSNVTFNGAFDRIHAATSSVNSVTLDLFDNLAYAEEGSGARQIATATPNFLVGNGYWLKGQLRLQTLNAIQDQTDEQRGFAVCNISSSQFSANYNKFNNVWQLSWSIRTPTGWNTGNRTIDGELGFNLYLQSSEFRNNAQGFRVRTVAESEHVHELISPDSGTKSSNIGIVSYASITK